MEWAKSSPTKPNPVGSLLVSLVMVMVADEGG